MVTTAKYAKPSTHTGDSSSTGKLHFIVPGKDNPILLDAQAMRKIHEIHTHQRVSHAYFPEGDFPLSQRYCEENKRRKITFETLPRDASPTERILDLYAKNATGNVVLVSRERNESLEQTARRLANVSFEVEVIELI